MTSDGREQHSTGKRAPATPNKNISATSCSTSCIAGKETNENQGTKWRSLEGRKNSAGCKYGYEVSFLGVRRTSMWESERSKRREMQEREKERVGAENRERERETDKQEKEKRKKLAKANLTSKYLCLNLL
jgi:hypothetical protein